MRRHAKRILGSLALATVAAASGLPPFNPALDFEYSSTTSFTGYAPAGATIDMFLSDLLLYGSPLAISPAKLELFNILNADVCYCDNETPLYPAPNHVVSLGTLAFTPNSIAPGTGVTSVLTDFAVNGALFNPAPTGQTISAEVMPVLFTGLDAGGASSYVYFRNADGTYTNTLHVLENAAGQADLLGVILDPVDTLTLDILGFTNPGPNSSLGPPVPEPSARSLGMLSLLLIAVGVICRRRSFVVTLSAKPLPDRHAPLPGPESTQRPMPLRPAR
jgi:hypothetical protein